MSRIILLVGALALAVAGTTTLAFRATGAGTGRAKATAGPLAQHLRNMREEMATPLQAAHDIIGTHIPLPFFCELVE